MSMKIQYKLLYKIEYMNPDHQTGEIIFDSISDVRAFLPTRNVSMEIIDLIRVMIIEDSFIDEI